MKNSKTLATFSAIGVYLLIAFEFFYMASPFAMYFYSVYRPGINFLNHSPMFAWMTGFFMPHLVVDTKSAVINSIPVIGLIIAILGFLFFAVCAFQIYYAKLFRRKIVTKGIYKYIRHPQYTAFALCSFGLLLLWPRYLTLLFYVILLFVYYWLARREERECEQKYGEDYIAYRKKTAMFFPLPKRFKMPTAYASRHPLLTRFILYVLFTGIVFTIAFGIKKITIENLYAYTTTEGTWVAIYKTRQIDLENIATVIQNNRVVDSLIMLKAGRKNELINYVLPANMYISEIPMLVPENGKCHVEPANYDHSKIKIIVTKAIHKNEREILMGKKLIQKTLSLKPITEIWVDAESKILKIVDLPESERYTNIPEPIY